MITKLRNLLRVLVCLGFYTCGWFCSNITSVWTSAGTRSEPRVHVTTYDQHSKMNPTVGCNVSSNGTEIIDLHLFPFVKKSASNNPELQKSLEYMGTLVSAGLPISVLADCTGEMVIEVGTNRGNEARALMEKGYCMIAVDASPLAYSRAKVELEKSKKPKDFVIVNVGLEESFGLLTFWQTGHSNGEHSSFDEAKAKHEDKKAVATHIQTVTCDSLFALAGRKVVFWLKIDIEERHFVCLEMLRRVSHDFLPRYVSWEMHEYARGSMNDKPVLDMELIIMMHRLGYTFVKVVSNQVGRRTDLPEQRMHLRGDGANNKWTTVSELIRKGIPNSRRLYNYDWWDFHMKLDLNRSFSN